MQYHQLGNSDLVVSAVGLGCVTFGREIDASTSLRIMDHAFEQGITLFDTAEAYSDGGSEQLIGTWLRAGAKRHNITLATKVHGVLTYDRIISSAEASLRRLQTDYIDLLQMHIWDNTTPLQETLAALTALVDEGKVRYVGCSNYSASQLQSALQLAKEQEFVRMTSVQPPYNLVQRDIEQQLLPLCQSEDIGVISYSPLAAGFLCGKYRPGQPVPQGTRFDVIPEHHNVYCTEHGYNILQQLDAQVHSAGATHAQVALQWVFQQGNTNSVLIGARNNSHVDQAIAAYCTVHANS